MSQNIIDQFARLLSEAESDAKRAALLKRAEVLAMNQAPEEAFEPPVMTLGEYLDTPIPIPPSLVWPTIVVRGEITATLGRAGKGKTTMNLNRILKWAAGKPLFDTFKNSDGDNYLQPSHPLKTLIIENEGSAGMFHQKMGVLLNNGGMFTEAEIATVRDNVTIWGDGGYSGLKIDDPAMLAQVRAGCEKAEPDVVFIEPFRSLWKGEENSSTEMANVVDSLVALATDFGCGVILSHHERKSQTGEDGEKMSGARGSTVLEGVVACMENFESVMNGEYREMTWSKARYLQPPPPTRLKYDLETNWYAHMSMSDFGGKLIEILRENPEDAMTVKDISELTGDTQVKIRQMLNDMSKEGRVKKMGSVSNGEGSTGTRFRLPSGDNEETGGIPL